MKACIAILFFFSCIASIQGQTGDEFKSVYDTSTIVPLRTNKFMLNNKKLSKNELRKLLLSYPESAASYASYRKNNRVATTIGIASTIAYVAGFFAISQNDALAGTLIIGGAAGTFATLPFTFKAQKELNHSVWLYNRAVLTRSHDPATKK